MGVEIKCRRARSLAFKNNLASCGLINLFFNIICPCKTLLASKILLIIDVKYWVCLHVKMDIIDMHVNLMYFIFFPMSIRVIMILLNIESYTDA